MKIVSGLIIRLYNKIITFEIINKNNKFCRRLREMMYHNICWKCNATFGKENPNRLFYVIRSSQSEMGLFGLFNYVVDNIWTAISLGAEPVVDWKYYPNDYLLDDNSVGKINAWELFFEPMSGIDIDEVYKSKNVIMSDGVFLNGGRLGLEYSDISEFEKTSKLIKDYIILNEEMKDELDFATESLGMRTKRFLGIKCRGTDFKETNPAAHSICPDVRRTADIIDEKEKEWGKYDKIYLVTEDEEMYQQMKLIYRDRLISYDDNRVKSTNGKWFNSLFDGKEQEFKKLSMMKYIISVYLLAECDALIAPIVGATNGAMRIKGRFEHHYIINLGQYK